MRRRSSNELRLPRGKRGVRHADISSLRPVHHVREEACRQGMALLNEFPYMDDNDNLDAMTGQLRLAVDHLMYEHAETARFARDMAIMLEENRDTEIGDRWEALLAAVRKDFNGEHPEAMERLERMIGITFLPTAGEESSGNQASSASKVEQAWSTPS